jgi:hypothetical protein
MNDLLERAARNLASSTMPPASKDELRHALAGTWAEVDALRAALAAERKHADELFNKLNILACGRVNRAEVMAHIARRKEQAK